ncbi:MAG: endopeptidase La [Thermosulfidibacteraceae bacterium]|jgi:ATP-dependent Lon protease
MGDIWVPGDGDIKFRLEDFDIEVPSKLPVLPLRDSVLFPFMVMPVAASREISVNAINEALSKHRLIFVVTQKDPNIEDPREGDISRVGVISLILRMNKQTDGSVKVLIQGLARARLSSILQYRPFLLASIRLVEERKVETENIEVEALIRLVRENFEKLLSLGRPIPPEAINVANSIEDPGKLADFIAGNISMKREEAVSVLEEEDPISRLKRVINLLIREVELLNLQHKIQAEAREELEKVQKEYFLREQLKAIQKELGEKDERELEIEEFTERIKKAKMPKEVEKEAFRQLNRLSKLIPESAEANVIRTYLEWLVELPWRKMTKDRMDIKLARKILDEDHYNLEKVKDRIVEYLALLKLKSGKRRQGAILCFVGPPGVGKTSLGRSIARALGRKFVRVSLGGVRDEAEIRGHRRTYVGALPGKIIQGIRDAKSKNPVFVLDEIDKLGVSYSGGDPASALLEVLDPEQNKNFVDHYLGVPFDLSNVLFICTANMTDTIPKPLLDRMEVIHVPGYTEEEKINIAKKYIIPKLIRESGFKEGEILFTDSAILTIVRYYTKDSGVRELEREIFAVIRKIAIRKAEGEKGPFRITKRLVFELLGLPKFVPDEDLPSEDEKGVSIGLAWTPYGGDIIFVESAIMKGKGNLILTGHLGDIMKESAQAALSYVRSRASILGMQEDFFYNHDIHVHVPQGAIPKDGPSAGVTLATSIISAITGVPTRKDVAMTGEITIRGKVLPIGGVREKVLAARRYGIKNVILPIHNKKDLEDVPRYARKDVNFIFVSHMDELLKFAFREGFLRDEDSSCK